MWQQQLFKTLLNFMFWVFYFFSFSPVIRSSHSNVNTVIRVTQTSVSFTVPAHTDVDFRDLFPLWYKHFQC